MTDDTGTLTSDIGPYSINPAWVLEQDISDRAYRLYGYLALRVNRDKGYAWPTRKRIAEALRCSPKSVDRAVQELIDIGAIVVQKRRSEHGDWDSNIYVVHTVQGTGVASRVTRGSVTGDHPQGGGRDTGDATGRDTGVPLINNYLEPDTERENDDATASPVAAGFGVSKNLGAAAGPNENGSQFSDEAKRLVQEFRKASREAGLLNEPPMGPAQYKAAEKLLKVHSHDEVMAVVRWQLEHGFWRGMLKSVQYLVQKWDKVKADYDRNAPKSDPHSMDNYRAALDKWYS